mgnify:CR=1 FL=1|tara:strand:+ start:234 stop:728 length:495 start_codon:yes stop_codon:yes gene_type:complete
MPLLVRNLKFKFFDFLPLALLFFISFNGNTILNFNFFTINLHYILVYYWVLRKPKALGYGFIFLSGIVSDGVFNLPFGVSSLALLVIAGTAAYVRVVTVRITLINDWISFIPALLFANFIFFVSLYYLEYSINYIDLFKSSVSTFIFYPIIWFLFSAFERFIED